jgi:hypothetical protein
MSVRKRSWTTDRGERREKWVVDYSQLGKRHLKTFDRKRDADAFHAKVTVDIGAGIHTPDSRSITVAAAGALWLKSKEDHNIEPVSLNNCRGHLEHHIEPLIGTTKLSALTVPFVRAFEDRLRRDRSPILVMKILTARPAFLTTRWSAAWWLRTSPGGARANATSIRIGTGGNLQSAPTFRRRTKSAPLSAASKVAGGPSC